MAEDTNLEKLKRARNDLAKVYKDEVIDEIPDNGNLSMINKTILSLQRVIKHLEDRGGE